MEIRRPKNQPHTAEIVRAALKEAGRPMSVYELHLATGMKATRIKSALQGLTWSTGGVVCKREGGAYRYSIYVAPKPKTESGSGQIAGTITIGRGYMWGAGLV